MMRKIKLICKNNEWVDFGNHTGFKDIIRKCNNLIVGELYEFTIKNEYNYDLYKLVGDYKSGTGINGFNIGTEFTIKMGDNLVLSAYDLHNFFHSIEEMREMRLEKILDK